MANTESLKGRPCPECETHIPMCDCGEWNCGFHTHLRECQSERGETYRENLKIRGIGQWATVWGINEASAKNRVLSLVKAKCMEPLYRQLRVTMDTPVEPWTTELSRFTGIPPDQIVVAFRPTKDIKLWDCGCLIKGLAEVVEMCAKCVEENRCPECSEASDGDVCDYCKDDRDAGDHI